MVAADMSGDQSAALARFRDRIREPRAYGTNDCCIAVADVLAARFGHDLMATFGRRYRTQAGFLRAMRRRGCETVADAVALAASEAGWRELVLVAPEGAPEGFAVDAPADFDLGLVWAGFAGAVHRVPAFRRDGIWHGLTPDGAVFAIEAIRGWRFDG